MADGVRHSLDAIQTKTTCKGSSTGRDLLLHVLVMFLKNAHNVSAHYKICFTL